jgi:hypothetical protein
MTVPSLDADGTASRDSSLFNFLTAERDATHLLFFATQSNKQWINKGSIEIGFASTVRSLYRYPKIQRRFRHQRHSMKSVSEKVAAFLGFTRGLGLAALVFL